MVVRSAFAKVFGSFPAIIYIWVGLGIATSVLTMVSILFPGWITIVIPVMSTTELGVGYSEIWAGFVFIPLLLLSLFMIWRSR
jgi:hypothetical protein